MRHAGVSARGPRMSERGIGDGVISHSDVYGEPEEGAGGLDEGLEQVREHVVRAHKVVTTRAPRR